MEKFSALKIVANYHYIYNLDLYNALIHLCGNLNAFMAKATLKFTRCKKCNGCRIMSETLYITNHTCRRFRSRKSEEVEFPSEPWVKINMKKFDFILFPGQDIRLIPIYLHAILDRIKLREITFEYMVDLSYKLTQKFSRFLLNFDQELIPKVLAELDLL